MSQKWLKVSFTFPIVAKFGGVLNDSCYVTKKLEVSLPFPVVTKCRDLLLKRIVWFQTQGALFSNLFSLETEQCELSKKIRPELETKQIGKKLALSLETNYFIRIIESNKFCLEFENSIIQFQTPCDAYFWLEYHHWGLNSIVIVLPLCTLLSPKN